MKYIINGALGRMGKEIVSFIGENACVKVDKYASSPDYFAKISDYTGSADIIIDFSHHSAIWELCDYAVFNKIPLLIATTGHTEEEIEKIRLSSKFVSIFMSSNLSLGIFAVNECIKVLSQFLKSASVSVFERHHKSKKDAPGGTALMFAQTLSNFGFEDVAVEYERKGDGYGEHKITFENECERITVYHEAKSRTAFVLGALDASQFAVKQKAGLYNMKDLTDYRREKAHECKKTL